MEKGCLRITLTGVSPSEWFKLNPGQIDYYRVFYTPEMIQQLEGAIKDKSLPEPDRAGVLDDVFAVCKSGRQPISMVRNLNLL